jgi:GNAT superfamily N-acetyltransferase
MRDLAQPRADRRSPAEAVITRTYRAEDEAEVLELLSTALGPGPTGGRSSEFFRWKHADNPFGPSYLRLAESSGRIVGLRAFMRWSLRARGRDVPALRAVDTATHPDHRGSGIFTMLTNQALHELRGQAELVFNTPNGRSLPGYLKMGWRTVGRIPVAVRVRRPIAVARGYRRIGSTAGPTRPAPVVAAERAAEALADPGLPQLLSEATDHSAARLHTPRDAGFLDWRYGSAPLLDYRAVREQAWGTLAGIALFRVRPRGRLWESSVAEIFVRPGDRRTAGRLLRRVADAASVDHVACAFPRASEGARAARRLGFVRAPGGPVLASRAMHDDVQPDPSDLRSWAISLGDLEVF